MAEKPRGLLLLYEGLPTTVIQSQVFARLRWLEKSGIAAFDVLSFTHSSALLAESRKRAPSLANAVSGEVAVEPSLRPALPFSLAANRRTLRNWLRGRVAYDFLQARGDYAAAVAGPLAQASALPMLWDCRGDVEAEFLERQGGAPAWMRSFVQARANACRHEGMLATRYASAACFVSTKLRDKWAEPIGQKPTAIIPCLADPTLFYFDAALRAKARAAWGFTANDIVFAYSGSLHSYQGFDETLAWFAEAARTQPQFRLLVVTPETAPALAATAGLPAGSVTVTSLPFDQVNRALNAADFGFLLRRPSATNTAAFPTKFAEYGLAGLPIVMSEAVPDCAAIARRVGNIRAPDATPLQNAASDEQRQQWAAHYQNNLTFDAYENATRILYNALLIRKNAPKQPDTPIPINSEFR